VSQDASFIVSNLVLDGVNANPVSYVGLSKFETEWLKNVKYLNGLKKITEKKEQEVYTVNKKTITTNVLSTFKLTTVDGVSCVKLSDIKPMLKTHFIKRVTNTVLTTCNDTGKVINNFNPVTKTKYINLTWLIDILTTDYADKYLKISAIKTLTT
jgi:hypothetical protein